MRRHRRSLAPAIAILILLCFQGAPLADHLMLAPYRDYTRQGDAIDWLAGRAEASGLTNVIPKLNKRKEAPVEVVLEAEAEVRASLMDLLGGLRVDSASTLGTMEGAQEDLRALLEETKVTSTSPQRGSKMAVTIEVPLWGDKGIISLLLPRADEPDPRSTVTDIAPASLQGESFSGVIETAQGDPITGLVIDATKLTLPAPALFGRVVDETGRVVHAVEKADLDAVRDHGLMAYAIRLYSGTPTFRSWVREGADPLHVDAVALGDSNTDLVITSADAERVLKADTASPFLKQCRVLVLLPPVGPMPDKTVPPPPKPPAPKKSKQEGIDR